MTDQSPQEDLALIRRMMEEGRSEVVDQGKHFLIWGLISATGSLVTWLYLSGVAVPAPHWVWTALLVLGWLTSMVVGWRDGRGARVRTLGRRMLTLVWVTAAVSMTLLALAGMFGAVLAATAIGGMVAVVLGAPVAATAGLTGERWLYGVAAGWWLGGGVILFVPGVYSVLLGAVLSLLLLAVPGAVLYARSRRMDKRSAPAVDAA